MGEYSGGMVDACGDSMSAAEHQLLRELTPQSGGIGKWLLRVAETPLVREYTYSWNGKKQHWQTIRDDHAVVRARRLLHGPVQAQGIDTPS